MGDEPYTTQRETFTKASSNGYKPSTSPHHAAYAAERARMLFGCYRRGDANDPETYVSAIAAVLAGYSADLIREVTDPRTGVMTSEKYMSFMPNVGELKVYCEAIAGRRDRLERLGSLPRPDPNQKRLARLPAGPGDLATIFVPATNPRYASLVEWAKTANAMYWKYEKRPGIWVSYDAWDQRHTGAKRLADYAKPIVDAARPVETIEEAK